MLGSQVLRAVKAAVCPGRNEPESQFLLPVLIAEVTNESPSEVVRQMLVFRKYPFSFFFLI